MNDAQEVPGEPGRGNIDGDYIVVVKEEYEMEDEM